MARSRAGVARLPSRADTGRAMSRENVEAVRRSFDNFLAGGRDWGADLLDPEIEWDASELPIPDIDEVYRGPEGVARFWRHWLAAWETVEFEYELIDAGDSVVSLIDQRMRGRSTGIEVPL